MRSLKICLAQAVALAAFVFVPAQPALALELPDVHVLSGEAYPEMASGKVEGSEVAKLELKTYLNDEGATVKGVLTANFGLGFETACENITKELVEESNKMVDFLF